MSLFNYFSICETYCTLSAEEKGIGAAEDNRGNRHPCYKRRQRGEVTNN